MVTAFERVTLYGLTIVAKRRVHYGPLNPAEARGIFIRQGLTAGNFETRAPFFAHNQRLVKEVQDLEHKARRRDVLVDEETIFRFYDALIPADIYNGAGFDKWRSDTEQANPKLLFMTREYLMRQNAAGVTEEQFPEQLTVDGIQFRLRYRFEPAHALDGVTVTVPLALLNQLTIAHFDWLVPGLIREKIGAYFKALPKAIRKQLLPLQDQVTRFLEEQESGSGSSASLAAALAHYVKMRSGEIISADIWDDADIPVHLRMNYRVIDDAGRELATGRDLAALKAQLGQAAQLTFAKAEPGIERAGLTSWDCGDVPAQISFERTGRKLTGYPALVDDDDRGVGPVVLPPDRPGVHGCSEPGDAARLPRGPSMPQHPRVLTALIANSYSLVGLLFFGWSIWTAVAIYWAENMIRIPFLAWRIRRAFPHFTDEEREAYMTARDSEKTNGVPEGRLLREVLAQDGLDAAARHAGRRFLLFYGVFALAHGFFVLMLGGLWAPEMDPEGAAGVAAFDPVGIALAAASILLVELVLLRLDRAPVMPDVTGYTTRTLVLHVTIVVGAFLVMLLDARALAVLFIVLKTAADLGAWRATRRAAASAVSRAGSAP